MTCPYCHCDIPDLCPFSMCPTCGQPIEARHLGNGPVRTGIKRE